MHIKQIRTLSLDTLSDDKLLGFVILSMFFFSIFSNGMFTSPLKVFSDGAWALFLTIKELLSSK